nr:immunoglobulin light chain junction region [Macaca mulatta]
DYYCGVWDSSLSALF